MECSEAEAIYDAGRDSCVALILAFAQQLEQLTGHNERLEERIRRIEEERRKDSSNSSTPPSQDPPKSRAERRREARAKLKKLSQRKPGAQPGHKGSGRKLLPEDQVTVVNHYPDACEDCGREFSEQERTPATHFGRHQVAELPPIAVTFYEHRRHHLLCPGCGKGLERNNLTLCGRILV